MYNEELFEAVFTYSENVPRHIRAKVEEAFMLARRYALELINPYYGKWNAEYCSGNYEHTEQGYNAFILNKKNEVLRTFNQMWGGPVELFADESGEIAGHFVHKKVFGGNIDVIIHVALIPRPNKKLYDLLRE